MKTFWESWGNGRRQVQRRYETVTTAVGEKTHIAAVERVIGWQGPTPKPGTPEHDFVFTHFPPVVLAATLCGVEAAESVPGSTGNVCKRCERRAEEFQMNEACTTLPQRIHLTIIQP